MTAGGIVMQIMDDEARALWRGIVCGGSLMLLIWGMVGVAVVITLA
jgi:hypothetical protein